jgi:hypothetical protein
VKKQQTNNNNNNMKRKIKKGGGMQKIGFARILGSSVFGLALVRVCVFLAFEEGYSMMWRENYTQQTHT